MECEAIPQHREACIRALYMMERGVRPVIFSPPEPKREKSIWSRVLFCCLFLFVCVSVFFLFRNTDHSVSGWTFIREVSMSCELKFHQLGESQSFSCVSDSKGRFSISLPKGMYRITASGEGISNIFEAQETTPFRIKISRDLDHIRIQLK